MVWNPESTHHRLERDYEASTVYQVDPDPVVWLGDPDVEFRSPESNRVSRPFSAGAYPIATFEAEFREGNTGIYPAVRPKSGHEPTYDSWKGGELGKSLEHSINT